MVVLVVHVLLCSSLLLEYGNAWFLEYEKSNDSIYSICVFGFLEYENSYDSIYSICVFP